MTRFVKFLAAALPLVAATCAFGEITGSKHDFTAANWADQAICKPCHTPHNAISDAITGRLWAHTLSTVATYTYHGTSGTSADGTLRTDGANGSLTQNDLDGATRLCMSCHDGTVALDSFMGKTGASDNKFIGDQDGAHGAVAANLGTDLSNDHPVGYKAMYKENAGLTFTPDGSGGVTITGHTRYKPKASLPSEIKLAVSQDASAVIAANSQYDQSGAFITYTRWPSVSCVSCHDVHNGTLPGERFLLRVTNTGSALCLACHDK